MSYAIKTVTQKTYVAADGQTFTDKAAAEAHNNSPAVQQIVQARQAYHDEIFAAFTSLGIEYVRPNNCTKHLPKILGRLAKAHARFEAATGAASPQA